LKNHEEFSGKRSGRLRDIKKTLIAREGDGGRASSIKQPDNPKEEIARRAQWGKGGRDLNENNLRETQKRKLLKGEGVGSSVIENSLSDRRSIVLDPVVPGKRRKFRRFNYGG